VFHFEALPNRIILSFTLTIFIGMEPFDKATDVEKPYKESARYFY
jgi:hypothetical protein